MGGQITGLLSPWLQRRRIDRARPFLSPTVLDFGCGSGDLARYVRPSGYLGVDVDAAAISFARKNFPNHRFETAIPAGMVFDTVVLLAVIEHMRNPHALLTELTARLKPEGTIVLTTPYPSYEWVHELGARLRVFSQEAAGEHESLLDKTALNDLGVAAGLVMRHYRRFLGGANQIAVFHRTETDGAVNAS